LFAALSGRPLKLFVADLLAFEAEVGAVRGDVVALLERAVEFFQRTLDAFHAHCFTSPSVTVPINAWLIFTAFKPQGRPPGWLANFYEQLEPFRIVNGYGLFRVMTKDRCEIVIEGSTDGINWAPYEFKWKPDDVKRAPGWCAPHQPRLDWQMWFAALETPQQNPWLVGLIVRLLEGSRDVTGLLARNPFPDKPPHYIRAMFYRYRFTNSEERRQTGAWWKRQELREYLPTISRDQLH